MRRVRVVPIIVASQLIEDFEMISILLSHSVVINQRW